MQHGAPHTAMKRRFVIPAAVALGAHALFLFGFRSATPSPSVNAGERALTSPPPRAPDPVPVLAIDRPADAPGAGAGTPVPAQPDVLRPPPAGAPTMPWEPVSARPVTITPATVVPSDWTPALGGGEGAGGGGGLFSPVDLDEPPRLRSRVAPVYPYDQRKAGLGGEVVVQFVVDESGRVLEPSVMRSSNHAFDAATLAAVARWRFEPGRKDGRVVRFRMSAPVVFSLTE